MRMNTNRETTIDMDLEYVKLKIIILKLNYDLRVSSILETLMSNLFFFK